MINLLKNYFQAERRSLLLAAFGASVGIGLGFLNAMNWIEFETLPGTVVARVNNVDIHRTEYEKALTLYVSEKRYPLTDKDRTLVLERLIEEELLTQHGLSMGFVRSDRALRMKVIQSLIKGVTVEYEARAQGIGSSEDMSNANTLSGSLQDAALREYVEQLRDAASIRWRR